MAVWWTSKAQAMVAVMVAMVVLMSVQLQYEGNGVMACSNELTRVVNSCSTVVSTGAKPTFSSPCCATLRSVDITCVCSQANAAVKGAGTVVSPATAAGIRNACKLNIPKGLKCAGLNS